MLTVEHGANDIVAHDCVVPGDLFAMLHMPSIYLTAVADNSRGEQYARIDAHGGLCIPSQLLALHACELICAGELLQFRCQFTLRAGRIIEMMQRPEPIVVD